MDRRYIDDHHVVARYLADRVTEDERSAFEAYYLEHSEVVQEMEAAARFKAGLARLRDTGELGGLMHAKAGGPKWRYLAAAAAIAFLVMAAFFALTRSPETQPLLASSIETLRAPGGEVPAIAGRYTVLRTRGSLIDAKIIPPKAGQVVQVRVLPEFTAKPARYRVQLFRMSADDSLATVAELDGLVPDPDNFVAVFLDGARLQPGQYRLAIRGDLDTDARNNESAFIIQMGSYY